MFGEGRKRRKLIQVTFRTGLMLNSYVGLPIYIGHRNRSECRDLAMSGRWGERDQCRQPYTVWVAGEIGPKWNGTGEMGLEKWDWKFQRVELLQPPRWPHRFGRCKLCTGISRHSSWSWWGSAADGWANFSSPASYFSSSWSMDRLLWRKRTNADVANSLTV